ncbi:MAG TPA: hypothetical protein DCY13_24245, partial [Verrucomicrobiales bacterium]|nr:hypothetical protein [Verrucomicrobiales bacterium]
MISLRHTLLPLLVLAIVGSAVAVAHGADTKPKAPDRGPKNLGSVLVFSGTGWYRHPETVAVSGWLARLSGDLGMQVDVSETPKDIESILPKYKVLVLNNCTEMTALFDAKQMKAVEDWYQKGGGIVALHASLVRQTNWAWFNELAGCDFDSDSEFLPARVVVDPAAKNHPAVKGAG